MRTTSLIAMVLAMLVGLCGPAGAQAPTPAAPPPAQAAPAPTEAVPTPTPAPATGAPTPAPAAAPASAPAAASSPVVVVTYFDVVPSASRKASALLRQFATATRKEDGNTELTVLHEIGRPGRFAIVEGWRDKAALDAHAPAMKALGDKLQPLFLAPFDQREFAWLSVKHRDAGGDLGTALYVLTHVDVFPAGKDEVRAMIATLAEQSEGDPGTKRFDAVVWDGHPNHFHLIEAWSDRKSFDAHTAADHTKMFRAKLVPFEGALYDERLYDVVK